jgi:two-component system, OmpR family, KDP operon response regulator KdpE
VTRVLVVDDEPQILRALRINLRVRDYDVHVAATGTEALEVAGRYPPDLVILDLGLPDLDGVEVIQGLRGWTKAPIIVLSGRADSVDKVEALDAGADDYVTKPFGVEELLARMRAAVRRTGTPEDLPRIPLGDLVIDLAAKRVIRQGEDIRLTPTEWHLLEVLLRNPGKLLSRNQLLTEVWGPGYADATGNLRLYMAQLRRKLEPDPARPRWLITEPGMGYRYQPGPDNGESPAPQLPGVGLAVPGEGAGRSPVGNGDRPDDAGRGLAQRAAIRVILAGGPAGAHRVDEDAVPGQLGGENPGQRVEPGLGHAVGRRSAAHHGDRAAFAAHVDDARPGTRAEHRQQRVNHPPRTEHVDVDRLGDRAEIGVAGHGPAVVHGRCIVYEHVRAAEATLHPLGHRGNADRVVHLELAGKDPAALGVHFLGGQLPPPQVPGAQDHREAKQGQLPAHLTAHAAVTAGHHGYRLVSVHTHHRRQARPRHFSWLSSCHPPLTALTLNKPNRHLRTMSMRYSCPMPRASRQIGVAERQNARLLPGNNQAVLLTEPFQVTAGHVLHPVRRLGSAG